MPSGSAVVFPTAPTIPTPAATVSDAMIHAPKTCGPSTTVAEARSLFADDHLHAVLVVDTGILLAVVDRADLDRAGHTRPAALAGSLTGRTVGPDDDLVRIRTRMDAVGARRLAVVDDNRVLLGLLCRKRSRRGFCSDVDVAARAGVWMPSAVVPRCPPR